MPMTGDGMAAVVVTAIQGVDGSMTSDQIAQLQTAWKAICGAIVSYIQANAQVASSVVVTSVSGVTSGPAVSGPGVGTATGTVM